MKKLPFLTLTALFLASGAAIAADWDGRRPRDPAIHARQQDLQQRVNQGIRSGELTAREAWDLRRERNRIRRHEQQYKSDGVLTWEERKDLRRYLNQYRRDIYAQKHDFERRPDSW
ncbi:MAG TPA: hypothetical protein VI457_12780 [Methylococcaceae bacterium]|nr:hypothetical protein [Methylococcaceae bacterium]